MYELASGHQWAQSNVIQAGLDVGLTEDEAYKTMHDLEARGFLEYRTESNSAFLTVGAMNFVEQLVHLEIQELGKQYVSPSNIELNHCNINVGGTQTVTHTSSKSPGSLFWETATGVIKAYIIKILTGG